MTGYLGSELLQALRGGGKRAIAEALARIEAKGRAPETVDLLDAAYRGAVGHVIGITGPPGVGKSTLIAALIKAYRNDEKTVGVIAIDPSSRRSGGALLGDRVRIDTDPADQGTFVRSMAARDRLGGLASMTAAAMVVMRAVYDKVIVETVGVGQSETDIASVADSVLLCVQPGSGDSLQYMKAGIAEIPDITAVTKADLGAVARQTRRDLASALTTTGRATGPDDSDGWQVPVLEITAAEHESIARLIEALDRHQRHLGGNRLINQRHHQAETWIELGILEAYGREGLKFAQKLQGGRRLDRSQSPFRRLHDIQAVLGGRLS